MRKQQESKLSPVRPHKRAAEEEPPPWKTTEPVSLLLEDGGGLHGAGPPDKAPGCRRLCPQGLSHPQDHLASSLWDFFQF